MTDYPINDRNALPSEFQTLFKDYPRDNWPEHPNFGHSAEHWLDVHQMFRRLGDITTQETEKFLNKDRSPEEFANRLGYYGNHLVQNLHGHHHWEDHKFFPEIQTADPRFERGLEMLETDHVELNAVLDNFTTSGNRVLKLMQLDPAQAYEEAGKLRDHCESIRNFLLRHLTDEEDLIVPILLHYKLRAEL